MGKAEQARGKRYEREVARFFKSLGLSAHRNLSEPREGGGDIVIDVSGIKITVQVKSRRRLLISDIERAIQESPDRVAVVIQPRRLKWLVIPLRALKTLKDKRVWTIRLSGKSSG